MSKLRELKSQILVDDVIDDAELEIIRQHVNADGHIDLEDMKFVVELFCEARRVCPGFQELLFASLRDHLLADGEVSLSEQFYLLKTLYADGKIDEDEVRFLSELRRDATHLTPEFEALYDEVLAEAASD